MGKFTLITSREYLNKITNKTFILSTLLTPLFIAGIVFFIGWLTSVNNERIKTISVVDNTGYIYNKLKSSNSIKYELLGDFSLEESRIISDTKSDYGLLYINNLESPKSIADSISFISEEASSLTIINNIESQLEKILTNENFKIEGIDIEKINSKKIYVNLIQETFQGEKTTKSDGIVKYIFGFVLVQLYASCPYLLGLLALHLHFYNILILHYILYRLLIYPVLHLSFCQRDLDPSLILLMPSSVVKTGSLGIFILW